MTDLYDSVSIDGDGHIDVTLRGYPSDEDIFHTVERVANIWPWDWIIDDHDLCSVMLTRIDCDDRLHEILREIIGQYLLNVIHETVSYYSKEAYALGVIEAARDASVYINHKNEVSLRFGLDNITVTSSAANSVYAQDEEGGDFLPIKITSYTAELD